MRGKGRGRGCDDVVRGSDDVVDDVVGGLSLGSITPPLRSLRNGVGVLAILQLFFNVPTAQDP